MKTKTCGNCAYWLDPDNEYDFMGECRNKHFIFQEVDDIPRTLEEMAGVSVKRERHVVGSDIYFETGISFGCIHFEEKE